MKPTTRLRKTPASSDAPTVPDFDLEEQIRQQGGAITHSVCGKRVVNSTWGQVTQLV